MVASKKCCFPMYKINWNKIHRLVVYKEGQGEHATTTVSIQGGCGLWCLTSVIWWRSVLLVEETRVHGENHRPDVSQLTIFIEKMLKRGLSFAILHMFKVCLKTFHIILMRLFSLNWLWQGLFILIDEIYQEILSSHLGTTDVKKGEFSLTNAIIFFRQRFS
jgi:hypothetical protein